MFKIFSIYFFVTLLFYSVVSDNNVTFPKALNETKIEIKNKDVSQFNDSTNISKPLNSTATMHHGRERIDPSLYMEGGQIQVSAKVEEAKKVVPAISTNYSLALDISAEHTAPKSIIHRRKGAPVYNPTDDNPISHETASTESTKLSTPTIISNATIDVNAPMPSVATNIPKVNPPKLTPTSTTTTTTTTTTVKPLPKKPEITVHSEDVPPLNVIPISKLTQPNTTVKVATSPVKLNTTEKSTTPVINPVIEESVDSDGVKEKQFREYFNPVQEKQSGFIIPIVISLLAVPMLGLIAYQAIRKGREAWRNRHYRRMDFLIDGMYND